MLANKKDFVGEFKTKMQTFLGKSTEESSKLEQYHVLVSMVKEIINKKWANTNYDYMMRSKKQVYYFSMEFLMGKCLDLYLDYLGIKNICKSGLADLGISLEELEAKSIDGRQVVCLDLGISLEELEELDPEANLGNGASGRIGACFLDSMAGIKIPGHGCGIRFNNGLFKQKIINGFQVELPDDWLNEDNIWEVKKTDKAVEVHFGGNVRVEERNGKTEFIHENYEVVKAIPYDLPILGQDTEVVNTLRLWSADVSDSQYDFSLLTRGEHFKAHEYENSVHALTEMLYPDDLNYKSRILRLKQEYFLVSAGLKSIIRRFKRMNTNLRLIPEKIAVHISDTQSSLAVPELMRILIDDEGLGWDEAWTITENTISFTNHTIMLEDMEKWPVQTFRQYLPRIYMIVEEINERFCRKLWDWCRGDVNLISQMAVISYENINMAYLAVVGSHSINGVTSVQTEALKNETFKNFYDHFPYKFNNKTNGISHRRWLLKANPCLSKLITDTIGTGWIKRPYELGNLINKGCDKDPGFKKLYSSCKLSAKKKLADYIKANNGIEVDINSIFDVQIKRIHSSNRQLLNVLHIMHLYNCLKDDPQYELKPHTFIFAGKSAPNYHMGKKIIKLINTLADKINNDESINGKIKIVFLEDYNVSLAELIIPAADISEQISTASKKAGETGNIKLMMNGAITLGTMDGANIEIRNAVGDENFIRFGITADKVVEYHNNERYCSKYLYFKDMNISRVMDQFINGFFEKVSNQEFIDIYNSLINFNDEYFVLLDFASYCEAHRKAERFFENKDMWNSMAITNIARSGQFSSDEAIRKYAHEIWGVGEKEV